MRSARARATDFSERQLFFIERSGSVWDDIHQAAQALSLFAVNRIVEIRLPSGKPGTSGAAALLRLFEAAGPDLLILIVTGQLERETAECAMGACSPAARRLAAHPDGRSSTSAAVAAGALCRSGTQADKGSDRTVGRTQRRQSAGRAPGDRQANAVAAAGRRRDARPRSLPAAPTVRGSIVSSLPRRFALAKPRAR